MLVPGETPRLSSKIVNPVLVTVDPPRTANEAADAKGTSPFTIGHISCGISGFMDVKAGVRAELLPALLPPLHPARSVKITPALNAKANGEVRIFGLLSWSLKRLVESQTRSHSILRAKVTVCTIRRQPPPAVTAYENRSKERRVVRG